MQHETKIKTEVKKKFSLSFSRIRQTQKAHDGKKSRTKKNQSLM